MPSDDLLSQTTQIVSAHVSHNTVPVSEVSDMISLVYDSLKKLGQAVPEPEPKLRAPAVPIRKSVTPDYLICLEDGVHLKTLKRHLKTSYNMTMDEYRRKWGLPSDYPAVAPNYAAHRSALAKEIGLGRRRGAA